MSPLLAQSGHVTRTYRCPLLGVKRTFLELTTMSAFDPSGHKLIALVVSLLRARLLQGRRKCGHDCAHRSVAHGGRAVCETAELYLPAALPRRFERIRGLARPHR